MKTVGLTICFLLAWAQLALGATIHLEVQTDKAVYYPGQTVNWTIYAWADSGDNAGIAGMTINLDDDQGEPLSPASLNGLDFTDTEYGTPQGFALSMAGTAAATAPRLRDLLAIQFPSARTFNIGNDDAPHVVCKGTYTANVITTHTLTAIYGDANYWPDGVASAVQFENNDTTPAVFDVIYEPTFCGDTNTVYLDADISMPQDCYIDFADFSALSSQWLSAGCAGPGWCGGADIDESTGVDEVDLELFTDQWLWCTDPTDPACDAYWK